MNSVNTPNNINVNTRAENTYANAKTKAISAQVWLKLANVNNHIELSSQYADICHQHKQEKKWVLFINPEESSLEQLAKTHGVDISKILCVSFKGRNKLNNLVGATSAHLNIEQIKNVLCRGNCSAVILSNASFNDNEMKELDNSARSGKTHCLLVKNSRTNKISLNNQQIH